MPRRPIPWEQGRVGAVATVAPSLFASFAEARHAAASAPAPRAPVAGDAEVVDYPAMFWMRDAVAAGGTVLELGGGLGAQYDAFRRHVPCPPTLRWVVAERPDVVAHGRAILRQRAASHLEFTDDPAGVAADVVFGAARIAFREESLPALLARLPRLPRLVVASRLPLVAAPTRVALWPIEDTLAPCWLHNRDELIGAITRLGYRLQDDWRCGDVGLRVPADPRYDLDALAGLCFAMPAA